MTLPPTTETILVFSVCERITPREEAEIGKFVKGSILIISITNKVITKYIDFFIIITQLTLHKYLQ